jgi:hypothetical protein
MPTLPRIAYIDSAFTGNVFPYFSNWNSARAALLALTPVPDVTHPAWATRFSAADGTQIDIGGDTAASLAAMGIILRDGTNGTNGTNGANGANGDGTTGKYICKLIQTGENAPVATEIYNTMGMSPTITYEDVGMYNLIFPLANKTFIFPQMFLASKFQYVYNVNGSTRIKFAVLSSTGSVNTIATIVTRDDSGAADGLLGGHLLVIEMYN